LDSSPMVTVGVSREEASAIMTHDQMIRNIIIVVMKVISNFSHI